MSVRIAPGPMENMGKTAFRTKYILLFENTNSNPAILVTVLRLECTTQTLSRLKDISPAAESATNGWLLAATFLWEFMC